MAEVRRLDGDDIRDIFAVINAAAERYRGVIPEAADTDPYMPMGELKAEWTGMTFYGVDRNGLAGVIGVEEKDDVTLIRHLYVRPDAQRQGIGSQLLAAGFDVASSDTILVGTWAAATWAIDFYEKHGFEPAEDTIQLLERYWEVPAHQRDASVVLRYDRAG